MRRLVRWVVALLAVGAIAIGALLVLALDGTASVQRTDTVSPWVVARARWLLQYHDPRRLARDQVRSVGVPAGDLDELINYGISRRSAGRSRLTLGKDAAKLQVSLPLPDGALTRSLGRYLNLSLEFTAPQGRLQVATARIGRLPVPGALLSSLYRPALKLAGYGDELDLIERSVQRVTLAPRFATLTYAWQPELLDKARDVASDAATRAALKAAQTRLASLLAFHPELRHAPLPAVLQPLLQAAPQREAVRASLLVLAARLANKKFDAIIPESAAWPQIVPARLTLHGRVDWAQHFVVSAAIAAWAGEPLADAIGLYKELADSQGGSGFSFGDLTADRAGTRFGELASDETDWLDKVMRSAPTDAELMPHAADLPEGLSAAAFRKRFGGIDSPAYRQMVDQIEARIAALPAYRNPAAMPPDHE